MNLAPYRVAPDSPQVGVVLSLIRDSFAFMDGRIDPPSSMHRLTEETVADHAERHEIWALGTPPLAVVFLTVKPGRLYLGKLAVDTSMRGQGLARRLVTQAETRARALGLPVVELETRVELVENHDAFTRLGFVQTGKTAHPGYDRPTSITMQKTLV